MIASKLTGEDQTTIPQAVRPALQLREGDEIAYVIEQDRAVMTKAHRTGDDPFAVFNEWDSEADRRGYAGLRSRRRCPRSVSVHRLLHPATKAGPRHIGRPDRAGVSLRLGCDDHQRQHQGWPNDVVISDPQRPYRLPLPSVIHPAKIATIDVADAEPLGRVSPETWTAVLRSIETCLALQSRRPLTPPSSVSG